MKDEMNKNVLHIPVLVDELLNNVNIFEGMNYLDGTVGYAGHFKKIYEKANKKGNFYGFDQDKTAYEYCLNLFRDEKNIFIFHNNFSEFKEYLEDENFDLVLLDLGVSSLQLNDSKRGFSYKTNARLDMRMNQEQKLDAYYVINNFSINDLTNIFKEYGECKNAYKVAKKIYEVRKIKPIETTLELSDIIYKIEFSYNLNRKNPAKQYFQALRIYVNDEINVLKKSIRNLANSLNKNGMIAIITFHSIEDRIIKNIFNDLCTINDIYKKIPINKEPEFIHVTKKPIIPSKEEISNNNRSHSAKLRIIKKI